MNPVPPPSRIPAICAGLLLALIAIVAFDRAARLRYDFDHFYLDARYVWEHATLNPDLDHPDEMQRRRLPFYLPVFPLAIAPLAAAGVVPMAIAWTLMHLVSAAYAMRVLARWLRRSETAPAADGLVILLTLLALPAVFEAARFNQLSFLILALVLLAAQKLVARRDRLAGAILALAAVVKLLPGVFLAWLLLKRRWPAAVAGWSCAVALASLPPLLVLGAPAARVEIWNWWSHNVAGVLGRGIATAGADPHFVDHRNQSVPAVVSRVLSADDPHPAPGRPFTLPAAGARAAAGLLLALLVGGWLWVNRRAGADLRLMDWRVEVALGLLAMLIFAPLVRQYYLVWALPAVALLFRAAVSHWRPESPPRFTAAHAGLVAWTAGMLLWPFDAARAWGVHLWMLIAVAICLVLAARRLRSDPP